MRDSKRQSYKQRKSTKDRFVSVLRGEKEEDTYQPWYRERRNYLPILAIFMFSVLMYVAYILHGNNLLDNSQEDNTIAPVAAPTLVPTELPTDLEPMDYEDAKRILGG